MTSVSASWISISQCPVTAINTCIGFKTSARTCSNWICLIRTCMGVNLGTSIFNTPFVAIGAGGINCRNENRGVERIEAWHTHNIVEWSDSLKAGLSRSNVFCRKMTAMICRFSKLTRYECPSRRILGWLSINNLVLSVCYSWEGTNRKSSRKCSIERWNLCVRKFISLRSVWI